MMLYDSSIKVFMNLSRNLTPPFIHFSLTFDSLLPFTAILFQKFVKIRFSFYLSFQKVAPITTIQMPLFTLLLFKSSFYDNN